MRATVTLAIVALGLCLVAAVFLLRSPSGPPVGAVGPLPRGAAHTSTPALRGESEPGATAALPLRLATAAGSWLDGMAGPAVLESGEPASRRAALDGDDLPPAPSALPPDPEGPYGSKYAGLYPSDLELRQRELQRKQWEVAEPLFEERFRTGRYRVTGPFPRRPLGLLPRLDGYAPELRPLVQSREMALDERYQQLLVVEVHPHELPELAALRAEELWLQARIDELEAAW